jgi:hypothetical protein
MAFYLTFTLRLTYIPYLTDILSDISFSQNMTLSDILSGMAYVRIYIVAHVHNPSGTYSVI